MIEKAPKPNVKKLEVKNIEDLLYNNKVVGNRIKISYNGSNIEIEMSQSNIKDFLDSQNKEKWWRDYNVNYIYPQFNKSDLESLFLPLQKKQKRIIPMSAIKNDIRAYERGGSDSLTFNPKTMDINYNE